MLAVADVVSSSDDDVHGSESAQLRLTGATRDEILFAHRLSSSRGGRASGTTSSQSLIEGVELKALRRSAQGAEMRMMKPPVS